ncbi:hypothetical protein IWZ01DRAFT_308530 [Phyllosticta capitalensis]
MLTPKETRTSLPGLFFALHSQLVLICGAMAPPWQRQPACISNSPCWTWSFGSRNWPVVSSVWTIRSILKKGPTTPKNNCQKRTSSSAVRTTNSRQNPKVVRTRQVKTENQLFVIKAVHTIFAGDDAVSSAYRPSTS